MNDEQFSENEINNSSDDGQQKDRPQRRLSFLSDAKGPSRLHSLEGWGVFLEVQRPCHAEAVGLLAW
jgi:hypothetical protein